jgi:hypothetical protein
MRYVVTVVAIFAHEASRAQTFDLWEYLLVLDASDPKRAMQEGLSATRAVLDDARSCEVLGYHQKPILYGIQSVHTEVSLGQVAAGGSGALRRVASLNEETFGALERYDEICVPYGLMNVEG